jgi:hypothetical protein
MFRLIIQNWIPIDGAKIRIVFIKIGNCTFPHLERFNKVTEDHPSCAKLKKYKLGILGQFLN